MLFHKPAIHATYVLCYLSRQDRQTVCPAAKVAEAMEVPPEQAAKVLQVLQNVGLVTAVRGRSGGYKLARELADISVLEVIDALASGDEQDRLQPRQCPASDNGKICSAHAGMVSVNERVRKILAETNLADVLGTPCTEHDRVSRPPIAEIGSPQTK